MTTAFDARYDQLRAGATRAVEAIDSANLETVLATLGMAVTLTLFTLPPRQRAIAARSWMHRLLEALMEQDDRSSSIH